MSEQRDQVHRDVLPIPSRPRVGLTTFDAKDPDTSFPPITPLRPPEGAPNVLVVLIDDSRVRGLQRVRWAGEHADLRAAVAGWVAVHAVPHDRAVLPDPGGTALGPQPPHGGDGRHHRDRHVGTRVQLTAAEHVRAPGGDPEAERVRHRPVREVPRGAGLGDEPDGSVRQLAQRGRRVRALLRLPRGRDQPVRPGAVPRHGAGRAGQDAGGGLPLHRGHDRPHDRLGPSAEGADAGQAVLRLLRPGCHPRASPRPPGVVGPVPREVRPWLGRACGRRPSPGRRSSASCRRTRC